MRFRTILIDPPWPLQTVTGFTHPRNTRPKRLPYPTMTVDQIRAIPVADLPDDNAHLWLWTTNRFLPDGFDLMESWGFKFMIPVHWIKPSGLGAWWVHRTQTVLFGYRGRLDMKSKLHPNIINANPGRHSQKPAASYELIEAVSHEPRVELFARTPRDGWTTLGNELDGRDITEAVKELAA